MTDDFDWTKLLDMDGLINTGSTTKTATSVAFMITKAQKARLSELGYSDAIVSTMTPEDAHRLLQLPRM